MNDSKFIDVESIFLTDFPDGKLSISERIDVVVKKIPNVSVCAIGGFPLQYRYNDKKFYLLSTPVTEETLRTELCKSLGLSGMLTYANKSDLTLEEMGEKCIELNHYWGLNFITVTLLFNNPHPDVRMAFLRDKRFYESWTVGDDRVFAMTGTIKDFKKFISNKNDKTFDKSTREMLGLIDQKFNFLWI